MIAKTSSTARWIAAVAVSAVMARVRTLKPAARKPAMNIGKIAISMFPLGMAISEISTSE